MADQIQTVETFDAEAVNAKLNRSLYAVRKKVFPKRAFGTFRTLKMVGDGHHSRYLLYYSLAALGTGENMRRIRRCWSIWPIAVFYFFFIEIWPQEFYYVAGMLVMAGIGLFLITSTIGRAWCGYSCWQTVWVEPFPGG